MAIWVRMLFLGLLGALLSGYHLSLAAENVPPPNLNQGKKWRIGYYEGGPWMDYRESLKVTVEGLMERGWIEKEPLPMVSSSDQPSTRPLWNWLVSSVKSQYIEFVADGFWTSDWHDEIRRASREDCLKRLAEGHVDLILAMGTWAGKDIANNRHAVPTMVMSTSDPIQAGIIKSAEDSGLDHVHARCDPTRHHRQINLFQDILRFKKIGVVYIEKDPQGRVLSHLDKLLEVGKERGFEVVSCAALETKISLEEAVEDYRKCVGILAPRVDAFYISDLRGTEADMLWETIQPLIQHKVPTWSARGSKLVERGALLSIARENFGFLAPYYSMVIAKIFHGTKPRDIPQVYKETMRLAINLETARRIGYTVPPNLLKVADIVYETVGTPTTTP